MSCLYKHEPVYVFFHWCVEFDKYKTDGEIKNYENNTDEVLRKIPKRKGQLYLDHICVCAH